ncbi:hypothetical protein QNA23_26865 [Rhodococcus erythropolis]|nr:hypothetical protein [Rhodococcus erythropolis]MCW0194790.1 hypothetical protein [Rhodococcus sp. (in: high G+C Gram-positive bacteria)]MDJ0407143.1 hypothetical protein [Rhodococcus erythropolis]
MPRSFLRVHFSSTDHESTRPASDTTSVTRYPHGERLRSQAYTPLQAWARTIHHARPHPRGIAYRGKFPGALCGALLEQAADPSHPSGAITATVPYRNRTPNRQRCSRTGV